MFPALMRSVEMRSRCQRVREHACKRRIVKADEAHWDAESAHFPWAPPQHALLAALHLRMPVQRFEQSEFNLPSVDEWNYEAEEMTSSVRWLQSTRSGAAMHNMHLLFLQRPPPAYARVN